MPAAPASSFGLPNNGFVPVATISPASTVADPAHNAELCYEGLQRAAKLGAKVVAFPEVVLTSYIADDLLYHSILLESAERELGRLVERTADLDVLFSVGVPLCINGKIYNTVAVCHRGRILGVVPKTFIPTYGVDFEGRWFHSGPAEVTDITVAGQDHVPFGSHQVFRCRQLPQLCVGYEICEDIWSPEPPSIRLALAGATVICNGSASNASLEKDLYRRGMISGQSARLLCCYAYCSSGQGDSTSDVTVGGQEIIAENGSVLAQAPPFGEGFAIADVDVESLWGARRGMSSFTVAANPEAAGYHETVFDMDFPEHPLLRPVSAQPFVPGDARVRDDCCDLALTMQAHGMLAFLHNRGASAITVLAEDTAVANAALAVRAFGSKYSDRELLTWMRTFYGWFFATQFMRHDLPDGPRIGSAGLDLRDGFMMPTYAQGALWLDEVDALLARIGE
ncbi:NAD synthetase [Bifidobacterium pseudolongum subsp. pseudolongum]|uniref:nitrilase-related carbon-nitrogen hydrolase n=1 Tax=Bifidobacterium pseudolongum TaxID=1694 RepID=UPI0010E871FF|nr:nitrilase-related carbon-nitrogen hydrolase [Bifidobacterium pseudolongum]RYQ47346.1 NAD synthetase [Bifidobacterium pseudolongum subsp. pseudolongum]